MTNASGHGVNGRRHFSLTKTLPSTETGSLFKIRETRSTGTVHTSAKARLTSVAIRIWISIWIHTRIPDPVTTKI